MPSIDEAQSSAMLSISLCFTAFVSTITGSSDGSSSKPFINASILVFCSYIYERFIPLSFDSSSTRWPRYARMPIMNFSELS